MQEEETVVGFVDAFRAEPVDIPVDALERRLLLADCQDAIRIIE
jgi:hypothetical protein